MATRGRISPAQKPFLVTQSFPQPKAELFRPQIQTFNSEINEIQETCRKWISEIRNFMQKRVPIILVMTKNDDSSPLPEEIERHLEHLTDIELVQTCSALTGENIDQIFNQAARICFKHRRTSFSRIKNFLT